MPHYLRPAEMAALMLVSTATLWRLVKMGKLPPPVRLSPRRVGWRADVIQAYLTGCETAST
jgi:prophage regulatory protein